MSDRLSRGEIISLIAGLPLAVAATTGIAAAADDSAGTKAQFKYQTKPGPGGKKCSGCALFKAPSGLKVYPWLANAPIYSKFKQTSEGGTAAKEPNEVVLVATAPVLIVQ